MTTPLLNNRYRILKTLGSGGFGDTFLAEDVQMPSGRHCVIKQLKPITTNPQIYQLVQERFQREAAILEDLGNKSNQIPSLYAYFTEAGQFYLVQKWVQGETLAEKVKNTGTLSESSVKEVLISLLKVLEFVHSKRIIHRDIKPDNIIWQNSENMPVLIDFGAVKESMGTVLNSQGNSTSSIVIGTPGFMPSEQAAGRPVYSSDIYALGLTAIYTLTGKFPQELPSDPQTGEIIWRDYALNISPTLAAILDKAIQSHPRERYATAREMLADLQPQNVQVSSTILSPLPPNQNTVPVSPRADFNQSKNYEINDSVKTILLGSFIVGGLISASIIAGLALNKSTSVQPVVQQTISPPQPSATASPVTVIASPPTTVTPVPVAQNFVPPQPSNQPRSIGWIRIGAVNNSAGFPYVGETLIATTQPVTISPPLVPSPGSVVTVTTGVNLRKDMPQKPNYDLPDKVGVLKQGQQIVILKVDSFSQSSSDEIRVWAEVGMPN